MSISDRGNGWSPQHTGNGIQAQEKQATKAGQQGYVLEAEHNG
jgi:hypothetical protein